VVKNALVLGGGGILGVAWETGMLAGIRESGLPVESADLIVGTSAGSIVGTATAAGRLDDVITQQTEPADPAIAHLMMQVDFPEMMKFFAYWASIPTVTHEAMAEIGRRALAARTAAEDRWLAYFHDNLPVDDWPATPLKITTVEAASGAFQVWDRDSGVPITTAVASSCAVPGLFPCVSINGGRYTDGGVRSGTSADLAAGYDSVLIIAPIGAGKDGIDPLLGRTARAEAEELRAGGSRVELAFPDTTSLEAIGINRMDTSRRPLCLETGRRQGRALAERFADAWARAGV
jgi:NTE family protein